MQIQPIHFLQFLIIFLSYFFALFLISRKAQKKWANPILALLLSLLGTQMLLIFLRWTNIYPNLTIITGLNCTFAFLYGPLIWLYTQAHIYENFQPRWQQLRHFGPYMLMVFLVIFFEFKFCQSYPFMFYLYALSISAYLAISFLAIRQYRKELRQLYAHDTKKHLRWLQLALILFSGVTVADILQYSLDYIWSEHNYWNLWTETSVFLLIIVFVSVMIYKALQHPQLFAEIPPSQILSQDNSPKYVASSLNPAQALTHLENLQNYMLQEKPYLNPNLSLKELAHQLSLSPRHLSQIINEQLGQNFMDFVNTYRVEEAKARFENPKDHKETVLEVMYEVGFNSKSVFNTVFKRKTSLTPTQFKRQVSSDKRFT